MTLQPGHGMPGGHGFMRSSAADRERAIDVLKAAFAEGRLTWDELKQRSERVYQSRTYADLAVLTADLPVGPLGTLPQQAAVPPVPYSAAPTPYPVVPPRRPVSSLAIAAGLISLVAFVLFLAMLTAA